MEDVIVNVEGYRISVPSAIGSTVNWLVQRPRI